MKAGIVDAEHVISGIDYMPTILDALGFGNQPGMDGASFLPVLKGEKQPAREYAFTEYHRTHGNQCYPMRTALTERMKATQDPALEAFLGRDDPAKLDAFMREQKARGRSNHE